MMRLNRNRWFAASLLAALMLMTGGGLSRATAQTKSTAGTKAKSAPSTTRAGVKRTTKAPAKKTVSRTRGQTAPTRDRIVEIQQALAREGFYSETPPSGKWDAPTTQAMTNFQTANGLTPTGKLGALSLQKLGLGSEIAGRAAPNPQADTRPSVLSESDLNDSEPETKEQ